MHIEVINPFTNQALIAEDAGLSDNTSIVFPLKNGAYRIVADDNYTENFGFQWNKFAATQI
ncbi:MAG: class I SAM-dependent methyltransferase, partial [Bacteroidota bacterium]|nr:class I SAM-dependent methyltransferase [Bacteroidota bacterium]